MPELLITAPLSPAETTLGSSAGSVDEQLLDRLFDGMYLVDRERRVRYWNRGMEQLTGYTAGEALGERCDDHFLEHVSEDGSVLCQGHCPLAGDLAERGRQEVDAYLRHKLGHCVPVSVRISPLIDDMGMVTGAVEAFSARVARKSIERRAEEIENPASRDELTRVPNRRYAEMKIRQAIQEFEEFGRRIGLLVLDVDHFKQVNETYGHAAGDKALRSLCKSLTNALRPGDIVGRWGGEEFIILAMDMNSASLAVLAERCRVLLALTTGHSEGNHLRVTVSLGGTFIRFGDTVESLVNRAAELMYKSKVSGRNRVTIL